MINRIEMEINNGRTMQLAQQGRDKNITLTTYNTNSALIDFVSIHAPVRGAT